MEANDISNGVEIAKQLNNAFPELYKDGLQKFVQSSGDVITVIPDTIKTLLYPIRLLNIISESHLNKSTKLISQKLEGIPPEKLVSPEPYVAVPAIQAMSYSMDCDELRELYANLLVSSMNSDTKDNVHPAFVEIIKQLSPTEARLLAEIDRNLPYIPCIDIVRQLQTGGHLKAVDNFTLLQQKLNLTGIQAGTCWDNLSRLKIFEIPIYGKLTDDNLYNQLENNSEIKSFLSNEAKAGQTLKINRKYIELTIMGSEFIKTCVVSDKLS